MPQLSPLRLFLPVTSSSSQTLTLTPLLRFSRRLFSSSRDWPHSAAASVPALAYARYSGGGGHRLRRGSPPARRGRSTLREEKEMEKGSADGGGEMEFNKKRAEGKDGSIKGRSFELKSRKLNPVNTICYVQILGTGMDTQDTSPSILLFFDKQRFIFNAGEGLQRFCTEHKIKLSKIDHIFLTRVCSETAGGLPGLVLTLAGIGDEGMSVNIWGPSDLDYLVGAMKSFIPNKAMLHTHSFGADQNASSSGSENSKSPDPIILVDDEVVRISAIFVRPRYSNKIDSLTTQRLYSFGEGLDPKTEFNLRPGDTAVVYACELPEIKGKFDPVKAAALGLKPGPKYRELQLGNSVMSDGLNMMVHPSDVLGPSIAGPIVLLVDCPTLNHMPELFSLQSLSCYYTDCSHQTENAKKVNCIIHLGPSSVTRSVDYQNWMRRFGATQHIMAGHEIKNMEIPILKASARISSRLNHVCPQLFPASGFWPVQPINNVTLENSAASESTSLQPCESISAANLLKFHLRPYTQLGLDRTSIPSLLTHTKIVDELISEIPEINQVSKQISQFWQNNVDGTNVLHPVGENLVMVEEPWLSRCSIVPNVITDKGRLDKPEDDSPLRESGWGKRPKDSMEIPSCVENVTREDMEITLLGTGSSQPSKYRNVSSIYINLFARGSLLLDCGEGTLGQLKRRFGVNGADEAVRSLRCIWISHIHADHHTGIVRILALRSQLLKGKPHKPLLVIGPRPLERFLNAYSALEDLNMQFLDCRHTMKATVEAFLSDNGTEAVASNQLESTLFAPGSRMESYKRKPGNPKYLSAALTSLKEVLFESGLGILYSVPVRHCPEAFGVVLRAREKVNDVGKAIPGWKLVYSGDTRPCPALIDAAKDATVLIHEATFEDSMKDEAIARNHSTTKEAIAVGTSAGAYRIILTHFSQRYPKIPVFDEAEMHKTSIAFDLMCVNLADLPVLPKVLPYLTVLFRNEMVVDESDDVQESVIY